MYRFSNSTTVGGVVLTLFGAAYLAVGDNYTMGTLRGMGPGYFPFLIGTLIVFFGGVLIVMGVVKGGDRPVFPPRPIVAICASIAVFGGLVVTAGLAPAIAGTVLCASLAERRFAPKRIAVLSIVLITLSWGVFVAVLGLPLSLVVWP